MSDEEPEMLEPSSWQAFQDAGLIWWVNRGLHLFGWALVLEVNTKTHEITEYIGRARSEDMQNFDQHLVDLLRANKISLETAMNAATNPADFRTKLDMEGSLAEPEEVEHKPDEPFEIEPDERF